jgi:CRISPR/Cas system-associated endonuclease Cas3-HD
MNNKGKPTRSHEYVDVWVQSKNWESVFTKELKVKVIAELHAVAEATYEMAIDDFVREVKKRLTN